MAGAAGEAGTMPAVSLPPKENALFKRILVSERLRAGGGERLAGSRACQFRARAGGRAGERPSGRAGTGPPLGDPTLVVLAGWRTLWSRPGSAHLHPRAAYRGLRRPRFRTRPRLSGFYTAAFLPS